MGSLFTLIDNKLLVNKKHFNRDLIIFSLILSILSMKIVDLGPRLGWEMRIEKSKICVPRHVSRLKRSAVLNLVRIM